MQKIVPHLWYNKPARHASQGEAGGEAKEAAEFYASIFPSIGVQWMVNYHAEEK